MSVILRASHALSVAIDNDDNAGHIVIIGDVVLSRRPDSWAAFFPLDKTTEVPDDFMSEAERNQGAQARRDPFEDVPA